MQLLRKRCGTRLQSGKCLLAWLLRTVLAGDAGQLLQCSSAGRIIAAGSRREGKQATAQVDLHWVFLRLTTVQEVQLPHGLCLSSERVCVDLLSVSKLKKT